jgi:chorismate synthase
LKCPEETGQSAIVTQRKEPDDVQFLSGIFEGKTGNSNQFIIPNTNQKSDDYSHIKTITDLVMQTMFMKKIWSA